MRRGRGCCLNKTNLLIALARAVGIPARYLFFEGCPASPRKEIAAARVPHFVPELYVEGQWTAGDPAFETNLAAVYETGALGKTTWRETKKEKRAVALPWWLWPVQRVVIRVDGKARVVRRAVAEARAKISDRP